ncbi:MAG: alpha/beta hydrolase [Thermoanaerobaculia bacterium]
MRTFAAACWILGASLASHAAASAPEVRPWQPPFEAETIDLPRSANGVGYRLFVRRPLLPPAAGEKAIAIYVLDGLWDFPAVVASQSNAEFLGHFPPIYYVGIGYQDENEGVRREENRTRDDTPTAWAPADPAKHFLAPQDYVGSGGGDAFLEALALDIVPFVEQRYPVDPSIRGIVGKSMGGLLATHALLRRPELFSHYLIISPALWWDDYFLDHRDRAVMREERASHDRRLARPTRVWIGAGSEEERLGMLADVYVLARALRLRNDPGLALTVEILPGEAHERIFSAAFARGLHALFWR